MQHQVTIRYGILRNIENVYTPTPTLRKGDKVVIRSSRGVELGEVVSQPQEIDDKAVVQNMGEVLYKVTEEDKKKQKEIEEEKIPSEFSLCQKKIKEHNLPMKLASVEHLFGSKKIIFYFLAKGRVDFRELVKDLAKEYKSRIEMKQIGVRDEARLLAEYEHWKARLCDAIDLLEDCLHRARARDDLAVLVLQGQLGASRRQRLLDLGELAGLGHHGLSQLEV